MMWVNLLVGFLNFLTLGRPTTRKLKSTNHWAFRDLSPVQVEVADRLLQGTVRLGDLRIQRTETWYSNRETSLKVRLLRELLGCQGSGAASFLRKKQAFAS